MRTTSGNIGNCGVVGRGPPDRCAEYCFRALLPLPREEFGDCSLEVDVCTCASQQSSQRGLDCFVRSHSCYRSMLIRKRIASHTLPSASSAACALSANQSGQNCRDPWSNCSRWNWTSFLHFVSGVCPVRLGYRFPVVGLRFLPCPQRSCVLPSCPASILLSALFVPLLFSLV